MPVIIPDDLLAAAGMNPEEALIEIACRLFDAGKLSLWAAARMAQRGRGQFEQELLRRRIPLYRPTQPDRANELDALDRLGV